MSKKLCTKCGVTKPAAEFYKNAHNDDGLSWCCAECRRGYVATVNADPKKRRKKQRQEAARRKAKKEANPIRYKAQHMYGGLRWGRGAGDRMVALIEKYLGKPCVYCGEELTIENLSLDHKTPLPRKPNNKSRVKRVNAGHLVTEEERVLLNSEINLHIVCLKCNRMKNNLTHEQFTDLLNFLDDDYMLKKIVLTKMKSSNFMFGGKK